MLGKLLKYELKSTSRLFGVIYIVILILSVVIGLMSRGYITANNAAALIGGGQAYFGIILFLTIAYIALVMAMMILTFVLILERFYRNLLKGEGYLMHTLPVPTWMLVASKTISAVIWWVLGIVVVCVSFLLMIITGTAMQTNLPALSEIWQAWRPLSELADPEILGAFFCVLTSLICGVLLFYVSMAIGGAARRHKKTCSVLTFVGIIIIWGIILSVRNTLRVTFAENGSISLLPADGLAGFIILNLVFSAVFFLLTTLFLQKKLNLE